MTASVITAIMLGLADIIINLKFALSANRRWLLWKQNVEPSWMFSITSKKKRL